MQEWFQQWFSSTLQLPQMQRAYLVALMAGPAAGLLGAFITARGMAFFSDAISHGAMTGVALGLFLQLAHDIYSPQMQAVLLIFCCGMGLLMAFLLERTTLRADTIIAFTFTGSVALGVVIIQRLRGYRVLEGALFGDILATTPTDLWVIGGLCVVITGFILWNARALTLMVVHEDLARMGAARTRLLHYAFVLLVAVSIALLLKQLGALLISGLIVIPAASARVLAGAFRQMLALAAGLGLVGALGGVWGSYHFETPTGPSIVLANVGILILSMLAGAALGHLRQPAALSSGERGERLTGGR